MSYRNDTKPTYDHTLLSSVPDPTRAERQEGYNIDLLDEGRDRRVTSPPVPNRLPTDRQPLTDGYSSGPGFALAHKEGQTENGAEYGGAVTKGGPWYRTRWGMTAIVIAIVLIIGAIVGGAVGGTHHSSHKNNASGNVTTGNPDANNNGTFGGSGGGGSGGGGGPSSRTIIPESSGTNTSPTSSSRLTASPSTSPAASSLSTSPTAFSPSTSPAAAITPNAAPQTPPA